MGYPDLAEFMTESDSMAIVRRFGSLNVVNLLYLQAELTWLEAELGKFVTVGKQSGDPEQPLSHVSWKHLREGIPSSASGLQWKKVLEIRQVLDRYSEIADADANIPDRTSAEQGACALIDCVV